MFIMKPSKNFQKKVSVTYCQLNEDVFLQNEAGTLVKGFEFFHVLILFFKKEKQSCFFFKR